MNLIATCESAAAFVRAAVFAGSGAALLWKLRRGGVLLSKPALRAVALMFLDTGGVVLSRAVPALLGRPSVLWFADLAGTGLLLACAVMIVGEVRHEPF